MLNLWLAQQPTDHLSSALSEAIEQTFQPPTVSASTSHPSPAATIASNGSVPNQTTPEQHSPLWRAIAATRLSSATWFKSWFLSAARSGPDTPESVPLQTPTSSTSELILPGASEIALEPTLPQVPVPHALATPGSIPLCSLASTPESWYFTPPTEIPPQQPQDVGSSSSVSPGPTPLCSSSQAAAIADSCISAAESSTGPRYHPSVDSQCQRLQTQIETISSNLRTGGCASTSHSPCKAHSRAIETLDRSVNYLAEASTLPQRSHCAEEIHQELARLERLTSDNEDLRAQLVASQAMAYQLQQNIQHILAEQQRHTRLHYEALDGLSTIRGQLNKLFTMTYELHEFTVPRLFILLPRVTRTRDRFYRPFFSQFRLFFLCECGGDIHLAKHEGYDIDRPREFIQNYGPYIVKMMQLVKYGIATSVVATALTMPGLIHGIEEATEKFIFARDIAGPVLDGAIEYLQRGSNLGDDSPTGGDMSLNRREALEGADLRRLHTYLVNNDRGGDLANLYRTVTPEGHVKWVCIDHYSESYGMTGVHTLKAVVDDNGGKFLEQEGKVVIVLRSRRRTLGFYEALVEARGIQELDITLGWDVTMKDLRRLEEAVNMANIVSLKVDGERFKGPLRDVFNRRQRFNPLLSIMANNRIQSMELRNFSHLFRRVRILPDMKAPKLRVLSMEGNISFRNASRLMHVLEHYKSLVEFTLEYRKIDGSYGKLVNWVSGLHKLQKAVFRNQNKSLTITAREGKIWDVEVETSLEIQHHSDTLVQFATGGITKLILRPTSITEGMCAPLERIIHANPQISKIVVHYHSMHALSMISWIKDARRSITLRTLHLAIAIKPSASAEDPTCQDVINSTVTFSSTSPGEIEGMHSNVMLKDFKKRNVTDTWELLTHYVWSIDALYAYSTFNDELAMLLEQGADWATPKLKYLVLNPRSLTVTGIDSLSQMIAKSDYLEQFSLNLIMNNLEEERERTKLGPLLRQHKLKLTSLIARGTHAVGWIDRIQELCPTRAHMPILEELHMTFLGRPYIPSDRARWLANMVSVPSPLSTSISSSGSICLSPPCRSLRVVILKYLRLRANDWRMLIDAIDFTALEHLSFELSNFSVRELGLLVMRIPDPGTLPTDIPLRSLNLRVEPSLNIHGPGLVQELKRKVPSAQTEGLPRV